MNTQDRITRQENKLLAAHGSIRSIFWLSLTVSFAIAIGWYVFDQLGWLGGADWHIAFIVLLIALMGVIDSRASLRLIRTIRRYRSATQQ